MAKAPSVWSFISKVPLERLTNLYGDFPPKVRQHLGDWLENQPWEFITGTDAFCIQTVSSILNRLVEELEKGASTCSTDAGLILQWAESIRHDPNGTVQLFKNICKQEMEFVLKQNPQFTMRFQAKQEEMKFHYRCNKLQDRIKQASHAQQSLKVALENRNFRGQVQDLSALQKQWVMLIEESLKLLSSVQDQALKIVTVWKRRQQMAGNGAPFDDNLLTLQDRLELIFGIYEELIHMIGDAGKSFIPPEYLDQMLVGYTSLIKGSFLVDKQPPQVLKTQTKFQASVNFMLGSKILTGNSKMPAIRANIITEKKAQDLFGAAHTEPVNDGAGEIENGRSVFEFTQSTRTCGAVFKNMLLKRIKRCERKGSESVTEEKCAVLFTAEIPSSIFKDSKHVIQVLSLPLVVIVHGNQDNNAKATILWDNAFSEIGRRPFFVEEKVPWKMMCQTLNMKFMAEVGTKQELTNVHFRFLAQKIFGDNGSYDDVKDRMVSWAQFNKEPLRERNFTFWQWFDGVVDLTKKHLKDYWSDGLIMGFVSKQYVNSILSRAHNGTFLLRFSDSEIGGITIAHIVRGDDGSGHTQNIQPFTARDLQILSLGDRVRDLKQLKFLHEKGEKDTVFEKYYKKLSSSGNGYKRAVIIMTVPGDENEPKSHPPQMNESVPMDECESFHPATSLIYSSPIYGSPVGSPIAHVGNPTPNYGSPIVPGLIPQLPPRPDPTIFNPNPRFMQSPNPVYQYMENSNSVWGPSYFHESPTYPPPEPYPIGATNLFEDIFDVLSNDCTTSTPLPMEEGPNWPN